MSPIVTICLNGLPQLAFKSLEILRLKLVYSLISRLNLEHDEPESNHLFQSAKLHKMAI